MRSVYHEFRWPVATEGYRFIGRTPASSAPRGDSKVEDCLVEVAPPQTRSVRFYNPLQTYTGLFRTFADTSPTPGSILHFAQRFGLLGLSRTISEADDGRWPRPPGNSGSQFETLADWRREISQLSQAVTVWEKSEANEDGWLRERLKIGTRSNARDAFAVFLSVLSSSSRENDRNYLIDPYWAIDRAEPSQLATYALAVHINNYLRQHVTARVHWHPDRTQPVLDYAPGSLLGAMWLQFAEAVSQRKRFRRCRECDIWFELKPEVARISRLFCSNSCRTKDYRRRQNMARELYHQGSDIEKIAAEVGTDPETAKTWIKE